jgi:hypothetical protein
MRAIRMKVTLETLEQRLRLPFNMRIVGMDAAQVGEARYVEFVVESPAFASVPTLADAPVRTPLLTSYPERLEWTLDGIALGDGRD